MKRFINVVAGLFVVAVMVVAVPSSAQAAACSSGQYNFRVSVTGGCAWGTMGDGSSVPGNQTRVDLTVQDTVSDGECVVLKLWENKVGAADYRADLKKVCGYKELGYYEHQFSGLDAATRYLRVCVGSKCSDWRHIY